jgi:hypothetical protein
MVTNGNMDIKKEIMNTGNSNVGRYEVLYLNITNYIYITMVMNTEMISSTSLILYKL